MNIKNIEVDVGVEEEEEMGGGVVVVVVNGDRLALKAACQVGNRSNYYREDCPRYDCEEEKEDSAVSPEGTRGRITGRRRRSTRTTRLLRSPGSTSLPMACWATTAASGPLSKQ